MLETFTPFFFFYLTLSHGAEKANEITPRSTAEFFFINEQNTAAKAIVC